MNQKERMIAGLPYKSCLNRLKESRIENKIRILEYNSSSPNDENGIAHTPEKVFKECF